MICKRRKQRSHVQRCIVAAICTLDGMVSARRRLFILLVLASAITYKTVRLKFLNINIDIEK